ncbi:GAP1-N2 domain-containing protein [Brevibacillus daliensis]|uniref:GAP1-N2 domain-containing protein n=1 Tax=Brevibacillus daliensis TaxID=2892995 RepID=UPI001E59745C|nr:hypothetical protein [Brevibacillus daliensis]
MSRQFIEQQYYTRGRQGIFRSNEGYDTVSKSIGLDNSFIKKTLHPFCVYDAPRELQERAESNVKNYPAALFSFRAESGEMVLGKSVYVGADFTGQRNTFFTHNYVIPVSRREEFIRTPAKIFGAHSFCKQYDDTEGKELSPVENIPYHHAITEDKKRLLQQMGITEQSFKQLLYAIMVSISSKKKVFISLDVDTRVLSDSASTLLEIMYGALPYEMRRHFGFLTYTNEPESKKYLHVMFVEKGSIRPGNGTVDKDFLFDFPNQRILNVDIQENHEYLEFAWSNLNQPQALTAFYDFADEILSGDDPTKGLSITTYYELCSLFYIESGNMVIYERNKTSIWQVLLNYLNNARLENKHRLFNLGELLFQEEKKLLAVKKLPDIELVRLLIDSYQVFPKEGTRKEIILYLMDLLLKGKAFGKIDYVREVYKHLTSNRKLFTFMLNTILGYQEVVKPLFEEYVEQRLSAIVKMDGVLQEISFWIDHAPQALQNRFFTQVTEQKLLQLYGQERNKVEAAGHIHRYFQKLISGNSFTFAKRMIDEVDRTLLKCIKWDTLSKADFCQLIYLLEEKPQNFFNDLDLQTQQTHQLIVNLSSLRKHPDQTAQDFFHGFDEQDMEIQQQLIKRFLSNPLEPECFSQVMLAFYSADFHDSSDYRFEEMLDYVEQHGGDEGVYLFIQWSLKQRGQFFEGRRIVPAYKKALKRYFLTDNGKMIRDKAWRKRWQAIRNVNFQEILKEVRNETSSGLTRFFRKNKVLVSVGVVVILAGGTVTGMYYNSTNSAQTPNQQPATGPLPSQIEEVSEQSPMIEKKDELWKYDSIPLRNLLHPQVKLNK